jgi:heterodisulfide reductase subunit A
MMDVGRHPNIKLMTNSVVQEVHGKAGNFRAKILNRARYVDIETCTSCSACIDACVFKKASFPDEFNLGLNMRKPVYIPFPQAVPSAAVIDPKTCIDFKTKKCKKTCVEACKPNCINFEASDEIVDLDVGSIIVATGIDYFNPQIVSEFGYARFKNVLTSLELERLLSSSGPTQGELSRLSDNQNPERIAFIQCVASRDIKFGNSYCSTICCMNAIKDAMIIREHYPDAKIDIFYIDVRAFGKGYEGLYCNSLEDKNITYIRSKPSKVSEDPKTHNLMVMYEDPDSGKNEHRNYGMVVLSSALVPSSGSTELAKILGIENDNDGFFKQKGSCTYPLDSTREGIYLCGCALGPKDITDSIAEASGAAVRAARHVWDHKIERKKEKLPQIDTSGKPRIGVFVCQCGINISGVVDTEKVVEYAKTLPNVVYAADVQFACAASTQSEIQQNIFEHRLNRVLVAACTPKTHEPIFQETLSKVGLNPYLFEMVNIRDQCSWVHIHEPEKATQKAKDLVRMGVAKARLLNPLEVRELAINHEALVIGGGIAGIQAAIDLTGKDIKVHLVEKEANLGGRVSSLSTIYPSFKPGSYYLESKIKELRNSGVKIHTSTTLDNIEGFVGNFKISLLTSNNGESTKTLLNVGAIVVATGADLYRVSDGDFGYGTYANVFTNQEFEEKIAQGNRIKIDGEKPGTVAFIQCVGSRGEKGNPECSRYCCQAAIKQAIALRKAGINVVVFHRDIRIYSRGAEDMYRKARGMGVLFKFYDKDNPPKFSGDKKAASIILEDHGKNQSVEIKVDAVVLSLGMVPEETESRNLVEFLKIPRSADRFFMERHPKLGPVETAIVGIYLCGCAQGPKDITDSVAQASAVAAKVAALLSGDTITLEPIVSTSNAKFCRACGKCVDVCEFNALELKETDDNRVAIAINEALCKGCGSCAAVCPTGAIDLRHFTDDQIEAQVEAIFME